MPLKLKLQPQSDVNTKVRDLINQYIGTSKEIPVFLHAKIANVTISDLKRPLHDLEAHSYILGIGSCFVSHVDAYTGIGFGLLLKKSVDFKFVFGAHSFVVF